MQQTTLTRRVCFSGIGLHTGALCEVTLLPAPAGSGLKIMPGKERDAVSVTAAHVTDTHLATTLTDNAGQSVATVEHLLSALTGMGVDNCLIEVSGPEIPILDGSARLFAEAIAEIGLEAQDCAAVRREVLKPVTVQNGDRRVRLEPLPEEVVERRLLMSVEIDFDHPLIGHQSLSVAPVPETYIEEIGRARTFGLAAQETTLHAAGRALGADETNTLILEDTGLRAGQSLYSPDEFVRHKALDALGDLRLAGAPLIGCYTGIKPGHALNVALVRKLLEDPHASHLVTA